MKKRARRSRFCMIGLLVAAWLLTACNLVPAVTRALLAARATPTTVPTPTVIPTATTAPTKTPPPAPTATPPPTATPTLSMTATPPPTATTTPTKTPTPAMTATPPPTVTPMPVAPPPGMVYRTSDGLWHVDANGWWQQLLPNPDAQLSPDGQRALYTAVGGWRQPAFTASEQGLWVIDLATSEERNLLAAGGYPQQWGSLPWWCCPRWAGDEMVLFGSWPEGTDPGPSTGHLTAAAADGSWVQVLDQTSVSFGLPALSPDGETIAYDRSGTAWLYRWGSGPEPFDVAAYGLPASKSIRIGSPAWSPDGRQLAWVVGGGFGDDWRIGIAVFDLEARTSRLLHPYEPLGVGGWPGAPIWSPNGAWLAYSLSHGTDPMQSGLWVLRADGQDERFLGQGSNPVWSPDGRWLVFTQHIADQGTAGSSDFSRFFWLLETSIWEPRLMDLPAGAVPVGWMSTVPQPTAPVLPGPTLVRYSNPTLGFAVDHPDDWEVRGPADYVDPLVQSWSVIEFASNLYAYGAQAFGKYAVTVAVGENRGRTLTETVEYSLSPIVPQFRQGIKTHCCLAVGGEPAMELLGFPLMTRWGSRQIVVIHDGREYRLTFYPQMTLSGNTSSDAAARAAFDAFLQSFAFIPITATPVPPTSTITPVPTPASVDDARLDATEPLLPYSYARVWSSQVPIYPVPGDPGQMVPVRYLLPPATWVSIKDEVQVDGRVWYRIEEQEYVLAGDLLPVSPSTFRGVAVGGTYHPPLGFVVADLLNVRARPGVAASNPPLDTLPRYSTVSILGWEVVSDELWYQIGPDRYVYSAHVRAITATPRPMGVAPGEKWIAVNLSEQTLVAYEGDQMVFATLISTGLPLRQTPQGLFRIWVKLSAGKMSGGSVDGGDYYYLQDVPWTMYFYGSYGLHGTYWHDGFGAPRSRGCVNLSPGDSKWLFDWVSPSLPEGRRAVLSSDDNPGTWVYVYSTAAQLALADVLRGGEVGNGTGGL